MLSFVLFVMVLTTFSAWAIHRDLKRAVIRQQFRQMMKMSVKIVAQFEQFQKSLMSLGKTVQEATDAFRQFGNAMSKGR